MATVSDATLALINSAETDLVAAQSGDATAATLLVAAQTAQGSADKAKTDALQLHTTATQSALKALAALEAELQIPSGAPLPVPAPAPVATPALAISKQHSLITQALNAGIDWGTILRTLLEGSLPALEALVERVLSGLHKQ